MRDLGQLGAAGSASGAARAALPSAGELRALTARLAAGDGAELTDAERIDFLRAAEELKCAAEGAQAQVSVDFDGSQRREQARAAIPAERQGRGIAAQIALARRVSPHRGTRLLHLAKRLRDMPETLSALRTGKITEFKASLIVRDTECLSAELREQVDLAVAGDVAWLESLGERQLEAEVHKLAYRFDPQSFVNRSAQAVEDWSSWSPDRPPPTRCRSVPTSSWPTPRCSGWTTSRAG